MREMIELFTIHCVMKREPRVRYRMSEAYEDPEHWNTVELNF